MQQNIGSEFRSHSVGVSTRYCDSFLFFSKAVRRFESGTLQPLSLSPAHARRTSRSSPSRQDARYLHNTATLFHALHKSGGQNLQITHKNPKYCCVRQKNRAGQAGVCGPPGSPAMTYPPRSCDALQPACGPHYFPWPFSSPAFSPLAQLFGVVSEKQHERWRAYFCTTDRESRPFRPFFESLASHGDSKTLASRKLL